MTEFLIYVFISCLFVYVVINYLKLQKYLFLSQEEGFDSKKYNGVLEQKKKELVEADSPTSQLNELGDFPSKEKQTTQEFDYPNNYKFSVKYPCRKTATGMFDDCSVYSANTAWTANPYKGLNCKYSKQ